MRAAARAPDDDVRESSAAGTPRKLIWVAVEASLTPGPGETVTRAPASAAETLSAGGTQLGLAAAPRRCSASDAIAPSVPAPAPNATTAAAPTAAAPTTSARPASGTRRFERRDLGLFPRREQRSHD